MTNSKPQINSNFQVQITAPFPFPSPSRDRVVIARKGGDAVRFPACRQAGKDLRMRVFYIMGNRQFYKIECFHIFGTPYSERLKVAALNLFHPTTPPPFQKFGFFQITTQPPRGEGWGDGISSNKGTQR